MNITKQNVDNLQAVITIQLEKKDFQPKVDEVLKNYKKNASVPGFRKGQVPLSMIQKQYGDAVMFEEINKILQEELSKYITEEKLDILGNPLPVEQQEIDWKADTLDFQFEIGLSPEFEVKLEDLKDIKKFQVVATDEEIDDQIKNIQKHYGNLTSVEKIDENTEVMAQITCEEKEIDNEGVFSVSEIRTKTNQKKFIGKKVGDEVKVSSKGLFEDEHKLMHLLNVSHDEIHDLDVELTFKITETNEVGEAELNQELFDKLFGKDVVKSEEELKAKIKEEIEKGYNAQADQKFTADVIDRLLEETKIDMPETFLVKWLQNAGEKTLTEEEAKEEYKKAESGLKYQLIENYLVKENNLNVEIEDIKNYIKKLITEQFAQFGRPAPSDDEIEDIMKRVMSDRDETGRIIQQITSEKLEKLFLDKIKVKTKEVGTKDFVKEISNH